MKKKIGFNLGKKRRMKSRKKRRGSEHQRQAVHKDKESHGDSHHGCVEVALLYAAQGLAVVPLHGTRDGKCSCSDPDCRQLGRHPRTKHGAEDATTVRSLIEKRWAKWPQAKAGVAVGTPSRVLVLVIEEPAGKESLRKLQRANHTLKKTVTIRDGKRRRIRLFRVPQDYAVRHQQLDGGLTVLGDGDILAMPSGIGSENAKCRFVDGRALGKVGIATARKWLLDHVSKDSPHIIKVDTIPIDSVVIGENRRSLNPEMVAQLAKSMAAIGQRMPITVRSVSDADDSTTVLVCGLHRIAAANSLGWTHIRAEFMAGDEKDARRWELAENLHHAHYQTALERDKQVAEFVQLTETLVISGQKVRKPGRPKGGIAEAARRLPMKGKTEHARRKSVERSIKAASVSPEAEAAAKAAGLDERQSAMLEIAKAKTPDAQIAKVHAIVARKAGSRAKSKAKKGTAKAAPKKLLSAKDKKSLVRLHAAWNKARKVKREFAKASAVVREQFLAEVRESVGDVQEESERETVTKSTKQNKKPKVLDPDDWC
jgi:ParB-like chromosome segregation protein Spo0J